MGILKKVGIGIGIVFAIIIILGIIGATLTPTGKIAETQPSETTTTQQIQPTTRAPENIVMFMGVKEGDLVRFFFGFNDRKAYDGKVSFKILDSSNKTVYTSQFDVKANQYIDYEFKLTGSPIGKVYEWKIPFNSIGKGVSNIGTAYITFTTVDGGVLTADFPLLEIPSYTPEEIRQLYETQYLQTAKNIGQTVTKGNFEVTLVRLGYFTHLQFDTWGNEVTEFRVDIKVKNIGTEKDTFSVYNAVMIVGDKQYEYSYNSKFEGYEIYPNVVKEGYIIFKDVPKDLSGQVRIIVGSAWILWNQVNYEFVVQV
jgi:hypothetical protein|uniref:DUF4352 domain-containing protein n=1 Tax=Dictyoglomus turgidum TaxID=513050 RepID=A0A7C3WVA3_9BACT